MKKYEYNYGKNPEGILSTISGYATETTNFGETAFGILNKSTRDKSNFTTPEVVSSSTATLFSVGNGTDHNSRKNIIELKADGSTFINGVGGYDGTNSDSATSLSDTLQNIFSDIEGDYLPLTGGEITGNLIVNMGPDGVNNSDAYVGMFNSDGGAWRCGLVNKQDALVGNLSRGFEAALGEYNVELGMIQTDSGNMPKLIIDAFASKLEMDTKGITISNKSSSDLLNAAGSTTSVSDIATQVQAAIVDQAPETLDTLNELAAALGDDPNFATTITNQIAQKADKTVATTSANGLMSSADKTKLDGINTQNLATKSEVDAKVSGTGVSSIQVVATLPDVQEEGVLYIVTGEEA